VLRPVAQAPARRPVEPHARGTTLRDLGYESNVTVRGIFPTHTFWFPKPPATSAFGRASALRLRVQHSSALLPRSTLTVHVDDVPVFSRFLDVPQEAWFDVNIPLADLRTRADQKLLKVELRFFNALGKEPCQDLSNPALWAAVHVDSSLHLDVAAPDEALGLSGLRALYADRLGPGVTLVLPDRIEAEEIPATVWLTAWAHGLVESAGGRFEIVRRSRFAARPGPGTHVIVLGTLADVSEYLLAHPSLHEAYQAEFNRLFDQAAELENGDALLLLGGDRKASHLFVTGRDAVGLRQAARYLADAERGPFTGSEIVIHRLRTPGPPGTRVPPYQVSLRRLGYADQQVRGVATHLIRMAFKRADLGENVKDVSFTAGGVHSSFLDGAGSSMTVLFNQVPIKAVPLRAESGRFEAVRVELPNERMISGTNTLEVAFDLTVESEDCTRVWLDQAWATLSADSYFEVKRSEPLRPEDLDFRQFPDPFLTDTGLLLPDDPDLAELRAAAWMLASLQRTGGTRFNPFMRVFTFSEWRRAAREVKNTIAIALAMERMGEFRRVARPPMQSRGRDIELVRADDGEAVYSARTVDPLGFAQLFSDPRRGGGAVLLLHATTAGKMLADVAAVFADEGRLKKIAGNVLILDEQLEWQDYDVGVQAARNTPAVVPWTARIARYRTWLLPPALVLLALFLTAVYRRARGLRVGKRT
jgi:hypothetical protein